MLGFALYCAEQAEDWYQRAYVLSDMALQAIWTGQPPNDSRQQPPGTPKALAGVS